jgi:hypothetical protein
VSEPTIYPDLNGVLHELVAGAQASLAENFCGAYLSGSFALGDADEHSDVDFIVVIHEQLGAQEESALQALHGRLYALDVPWAQHLEGSYVPKESFRRVDPLGTPYLFLDNGARELVWDEHCNTAVARWSLREHGIALAGPGPKSLVDPVTAEQLRSEARTKLLEYVDWAKSPKMSRWKQPYLVITYCRMLHTLSVGTVVSKREAGEWALGALDGRWTPLVQHALDDRPDPWGRVHQQAGAEDVAETLAFGDYVIDRATL